MLAATIPMNRVRLLALMPRAFLTTTNRMDPGRRDRLAEGTTTTTIHRHLHEKTAPARIVDPLARRRLAMSLLAANGANGGSDPRVPSAVNQVSATMAICRRAQISRVRHSHRVSPGNRTLRVRVDLTDRAWAVSRAVGVWVKTISSAARKVAVWA